jgi:hypothetical protein
MGRRTRRGKGSNFHAEITVDERVFVRADNLAERVADRVMKRGTSMAKVTTKPKPQATRSAPASVRAALLDFFKSRCPNPALITPSADARHLCGFDNLGSWRAIVPTINALPALAAAKLWLAPATAIDSCLSVADIEAKLVKRPGS